VYVRDEYAADRVARDIGSQELPQVGLNWRESGE